MEKIIKNFVILCIAYVIAQGFCYKNVLASSNKDNLPSISSATSDEAIPKEQDKNSDNSSQNNEISDTQSKNAPDLNKQIATQNKDTVSKSDIYCDEDSSVQNESTASTTNTYYTENSSTNNTYNESNTQSNLASKATPSSSEDAKPNTLIKYNISLDKKWKILFNQPVDINYLKDNIKLVDSDNNNISITLSSEDNGTSVVITPENTYAAETNYTLTLGEDIISLYNKKLKNPTTVKFKTTLGIASIDDIDVSIAQESDYSLPTEVSAKMSDNSTSSVNISWNKSVDNTSIPGTYTYTGTVGGYSEPVTLSLTVNPFEPVKSISNEYRTQSTLGTDLYNYLMNYDNRQSVLNTAIELHDGITSNNCVYFTSEALRRVGLTDLPNSVANTVTLTSQLQSRGWQTSSDLSKLLPGDICFTTSYGDGPTHAYTFMGWVSQGDYDYGYVCDNQGYDYDDNAYHKRNISFATSAKDALSYFMYTL